MFFQDEINSKLLPIDKFLLKPLIIKTFKRIVSLTGGELLLNNGNENGYFPFLNMVAMIWNTKFYRLYLSFTFFCLFAFSRATPAAYGGSQARGLIGAVATHLQRGIRAESATYTTAHGNARSLTH